MKGHVLRTGLAALTTAVCVLGGAVTPSLASSATIAERLAEQTLAEVRASAQSRIDSLPGRPEVEPEAPVATAILEPGTPATISTPPQETTPDSAASSTASGTFAPVQVDFSGHDIAETLTLELTRPAGDAAASAAAETGGSALAAPIEVTATTAAGTEVTRFPAEIVTSDAAQAPRPDGVEFLRTVEEAQSAAQPITPTGTGPVPDPHEEPGRATDVVPGVALQLEIPGGAKALEEAGIDPTTVTIYTREHAGEPWSPIPSYFDATTGTAKGEIDHLSQFVVIGIPIRPTPRPTVVLDPDDDIGWATTPAPPVTELPYNVALAQGVQAILQAQCLARVSLTRDDPAIPFVSHAMRAAIAVRLPEALGRRGKNRFQSHRHRHQ